MRNTLFAAAALFGMALAGPASAQTVNSTPGAGGGVSREYAKTAQLPSNPTSTLPPASMRGISPGYTAGYPGVDQTEEAGTLGIEVSPPGTPMNPTGHAR